MTREHVPSGYAETLDCMNRPRDWDVPGMIADMAEYIRTGLEVPPGQLLAAIDWMTFRLKESASAMRGANITDESVATLIETVAGSEAHIDVRAGESSARRIVGGAGDPRLGARRARDGSGGESHPVERVEIRFGAGAQY